MGVPPQTPPNCNHHCPDASAGPTRRFRSAPAWPLGGYRARSRLKLPRQQRHCGGAQGGHRAHDLLRGCPGPCPRSPTPNRFSALRKTTDGGLQRARARGRSGGVTELNINRTALPECYDRDTHSRGRASTNPPATQGGKSRVRSHGRGLTLGLAASKSKPRATSPSGRTQR